MALDELLDAEEVAASGVYGCLAPSCSSATPAVAYSDPFGSGTVEDAIVNATILLRTVANLCSLVTTCAQFNETKALIEDITAIYTSIGVSYPVCTAASQNVTAVQRFPARCLFTSFAFEDGPGAFTDFDYNDWVIALRWTNALASDNSLSLSLGEYVPQARGAEFGSRFQMYLGGGIPPNSNLLTPDDAAITGSAVASVQHYDGTSFGTVGSFLGPFTALERLPIFNNTMLASDPLTTFFNTERGTTPVDPALNARHTADVCQPALNMAPAPPSLTNYYTLLRVLGDIMDVSPVQYNATDPITPVRNEADIDATNGLPRGFPVPVSFNWTVERITTSKAYPNLLDFIAWIQNPAGALPPAAEFWYNFPDPAEADNIYPADGV